MVLGQFQQRGSAFKLALPVVQLPLKHVACKPLSLPVGKVGVLNGQLRQRRRAFRAVRLVERGQLPYQYAGRPAIGHDVMHREESDLLVVGKLQHARSQQRTSGQVERPPSLFNDQPLNLSLSLNPG